MSASKQIAGAILRDEQNRYLFVQEKIPKAYGLWNLPAGHVDPGETPQEAAVREVKEEVGLDITIGIVPLHTFTSLSGKEFSVFMGEIVGGEMQADLSELLDARWLTYAEIGQLNAAGTIRDSGVLDAIEKVERL
jgi:mutator protein MutT